MKKKFILRNSLILLVILIITILTSCASKQPPKDKGPIDRVVMNTVPEYYSLLLLVAKDRGYFAEDGLDVTLNLYGTGKICLDKLGQGRGDFATSSEFGFTQKSLENGSEDMRIIASVAKFRGEEIIARRDRGIQKPSDLAGKRIGVQQNSTLDFSLSRFLVLNSIPSEKITFVNLTYDQCVEAISKGDVDATILFGSRLLEAKKQLGGNVVSWPARSAQDVYWVLVGKKEYIDEKPGVPERMLRALLEAEQFARTHPEETKTILIKNWGNNVRLLQYEQETTRLEISLDQSMIIAMEDEADWLIKKNLTENKSVPNYLDFIYQDALNKVNPGANTIFK